MKRSEALEEIRMKLIIAGSRTLNPCPTFIMNAIEMLEIPFDVKTVEVVCGGASGVDLSGSNFAEDYFYTPLKVKLFPADWNTHGKAAGPIRNKQMAEYGDALLLIWDGESRGSASMKNEMIKLGKPVYEIIIKRTNI